MSELLVCRADGTFTGEITPSEIDHLLSKKDNTIWLDIRDPGERDTAILRDEFHFHPLSIEDATRTHERPKIEKYQNYYFIVFYAACFHAEDESVELQSLSLFIGSNYLVSVHQGEFKQVQETIERWRAPNSPLGDSIGALVYALLDSIVDDYFPLMDEISDHVEDLEDTIFEHFDQSAIETIFRLKRDLLKLRRAVAPERDVMNVLLRREMQVFQDKDTAYLQDLYDHIVRVSDTIDSYRDILSSALDSYLSLQSNQLNQLVKVLTLTSIILMTDALIAGIYGMNFAHMPELSWQYGYAYSLGLMVVLSVGLFAFFKYRKWL